MKKKIVALCLVIAMVATAIVGGTLAYFTDTDAQVNTFTTGNVKIDLFEDFGGNTGLEKLLPATGSAQAGTLKNGVEKEVYVQNIGSEDAFIRVHIAIPAILDNGDPDFDASSNILHFNFEDESVAEGKWDWSKAADDGKTTGNWNYYETTIEGIAYNVYVVTYTTALKKGEVTCDAMSQVYLDGETTNEDIAKITEILGGYWHMFVVAEAGQAEGFADAYAALNAQFGEPGSYAVDFLATEKGWTFQDWTNIVGE